MNEHQPREFTCTTCGGRQQDFDWQNWSAPQDKGAHVQYPTAEDLEFIAFEADKFASS